MDCRPWHGRDLKLSGMEALVLLAMGCPLVLCCGSIVCIYRMLSCLDVCVLKTKTVSLAELSLHVVDYVAFHAAEASQTRDCFFVICEQVKANGCHGPVPLLWGEIPSRIWSAPSSLLEWRLWQQPSVPQIKLAGGACVDKESLALASGEC